MCCVFSFLGFVRIAMFSWGNDMSGCFDYVPQLKKGSRARQGEPTLASYQGPLGGPIRNSWDLR